MSSTTTRRYRSLSDAVDAAVAEENRRALADKAQQEDYARWGDTLRHRLEDEGVLPVLKDDAGCTLHR